MLNESADPPPIDSVLSDRSAQRPSRVGPVPDVGTPATPELPILITAATAAQLCAVSLRTWRRFEAEGTVPSPVSVGGRLKRYRRAEVVAWAEAGCPFRQQWESFRQVEQRRRTK